MSFSSEALQELEYFYLALIHVASAFTGSVSAAFAAGMTAPKQTK